MTTPTEGAKPEKFQDFKAFTAPAINNIFSSPVYEEKGIKYAYYKETLPIQPFTVDRPSREWEFILKSNICAINPRSKNTSTNQSIGWSVRLSHRSLDAIHFDLSFTQSSAARNTRLTSFAAFFENLARLEKNFR